MLLQALIIHFYLRLSYALFHCVNISQFITINIEEKHFQYALGKGDKCGKMYFEISPFKNIQIWFQPSSNKEMF